MRTVPAPSARPGSTGTERSAGEGPRLATRQPAQVRGRASKAAAVGHAGRPRRPVGGDRDRHAGGGGGGRSARPSKVVRARPRPP